MVLNVFLYIRTVGLLKNKQHVQNSPLIPKGQVDNEIFLFFSISHSNYYSSSSFSSSSSSFSSSPPAPLLCRADVSIGIDKSVSVFRS